MKARIGHALFALILAGSVLANARPANVPIAAKQLTAAIIDVAQTNGLNFRGETTLANKSIDILAFAAKDCREPITVALTTTTPEQVPLLEALNPPGQVLHFVLYGHRWRQPDHVLIFWERKKQKVLAAFGLTRLVPPEYMLAIGAPSACSAVEAIDWQRVWDRSYLTHLATDRSPRGPGPG